MTMGEKILRLRKARGWSQEELAGQMNVTRQAVSRWESDSAKPDADNIAVLCNLFGVSADYMLSMDNTAAPVTAVVAPVRSSDKGGLHRLIIGIVFLALSTLMFFALALVSAVDPWVYSDGLYSYDGIAGYVLAHDMQWLIVCVVLLFFAGLALLLWKYVLAVWNRLRAFLKK